MIAMQRLGKHVPATTNTRNNKIIVGGVCLWVCLCIPISLLGNSSVKTFPLLRRIFGGVGFYVTRVVLKESRLSVLPRTSCYVIGCVYKYEIVVRYYKLVPYASIKFQWQWKIELIALISHSILILRTM
jgi:hypothetical protein